MKNIDNLKKEWIERCGEGRSYLLSKDRSTFGLENFPSETCVSDKVVRFFFCLVCKHRQERNKQLSSVLFSGGF